MARMLVVDDDADIRDLIVFRLEQAGHQVRAVGDGTAALAAVAGERFDLVVLDWMLPGLTGPEICRRLRALPEGQHLAVLMLTAKAHEADVEAGFQAGADDYLIKPFSPRELSVRAEALLSRLRLGI
ncbi:hypothetical protein GCM10010156_74090 [Planobispora rosea]|uniref:Response regulatory domain-containing protein n=1 Tax=Planobispora rosea TaxID=35762 RepID=A0A8J3S6P9_PLARO|nr:response regulator [Planobispora rosea]GGT05552.1 hypothetical protein GCM10010156_74090 [Planobispora rosea]GIH88942.1 hypothetical protein Pro02_73500 [Planobispora rosea]